MNWGTLFEKNYHMFTGVSEAELEQFQNSWNKPMNDLEIQEIVSRQRNPFPINDPLHGLYKPFDPSLWSIPQKTLPESYLAFLRYSNGGEFGNGDRYLQFFSAEELRAMMLAYEFPQYMPGAVPFAMDGSGNHYCWDMRSERDDREYPILVASSGNLGYEDCIRIADTFVELCLGTTSADDALHG
ncbi:SMI1/KNR4 family protein [Paenibacillus gorillae]|uniref:SMI1/KNR4 family protein n=2 Tax=Bacillota TaxID=1239 RepID=UPI0004AF56A1|nr:SMI1/KNR4 family protein [Paenibacillus gorillae]